MSTTQATQFSFGSGFLYGIGQVTTYTPTPTPVLLGTLQDCSYDISSSTKELYGQLQFAVALGRGAAKFSGKAKFGSFSSLAWNTFFFGPGSDGSALPTTTTTGGSSPCVGVDREIGTTTSHAYTFANTASGTFDYDLGVVYTATGGVLTKVASAPAIGQYSVNTGTGTWTFNASDTAANAAGGISVAYTWIPTTPTQIVQAINNNAFPMGSAPLFQIVHHVPYATGGTTSSFKIYGAMASKLSFDFKNQDFTIPDIDFMMQANSAGKVMDLILST